MKYLPVKSCPDCSHYSDMFGACCFHGLSNVTEWKRRDKIPSWCPLQGTCDTCKHCKMEIVLTSGIQTGKRPKCQRYHFQILDPQTMSCPQWEKKGLPHEG